MAYSYSHEGPPVTNHKLWLKNLGIYSSPSCIIHAGSKRTCKGSIGELFNIQKKRLHLIPSLIQTICDHGLVFEVQRVPSSLPHANRFLSRREYFHVHRHMQIIHDCSVLPLTSLILLSTSIDLFSSQKHTAACWLFFTESNMSI